jgi:hypothetical protein
MFHQIKHSCQADTSFRVFEVLIGDPELTKGFYWESIEMAIYDNEAMGPFKSYDDAYNDAEAFFSEEIV